MEKVDIIGSDNQVIGQDTRENSHRIGSLHRCVIAEYRDNKNNWIFVKQSSSMQDAGQLASAVGGHVKAGEEPINALRREVLEELGISKFRSIHKGNFVYQRETLGRDENHYFMVYEIYSEDRITLNEESEETVQMSAPELTEALKKQPERFGSALLNILHKLYPELFL
jgi:8-oxo-dGTP pyrophosphatase MutT (NUDIX family)